MVRAFLLLSNLVLLSSILLTRYQKEIGSFQWNTHVKKYQEKVKTFFQNFKTEQVIQDAVKLKDVLVDHVVKFDYEGAIKARSHDAKVFLHWFQTKGHKQIVDFATDFAIEFKAFVVKYGMKLYAVIRTYVDTTIDYIHNFDPEEAKMQLIQFKDNAVYYVENFNHTEAQHAIMAYSSKLANDVKEYANNVNVTALREAVITAAHQARVLALGVSGEIVLFIKSIDTKPAQELALLVLKRAKRVGEHAVVAGKVASEMTVECIQSINTTDIEKRVDAVVAYAKVLGQQVKDQSVVIFVYLRDTSPDDIMADAKVQGRRALSAVHTFNSTLAIETAKIHTSTTQEWISSTTVALLEKSQFVLKTFVAKYRIASAHITADEAVESLQVTHVDAVHQEEVAPVESVPEEVALAESVHQEEEVQSESVHQEEVAQAESVPEEVAPVEPVPEEVVQAESVPEEVVQAEPVPEEVAPVEPVPEEVVQAESVPEEVAPVESVPEEVAQAESVPEEVAQAESVPEEVAPVETVPEEVAPVESVPEEVAPVESVPEEVAPVESVPEEVAPVEPVKESVADASGEDLQHPSSVEETVGIAEATISVSGTAESA